MVVDDLELCNADQPGVVVQVFRDAVGRHMRKLAGLRAGVVTRVQQALLERASFHLAVPMIEAWLFADPQGPANAGVPTQRLPPQWAAHQCPEDFLTLDHNYASAPACAEWLKLPLPKQTKSSRPQWLIDARERHPKAFLSWLCREEVPRKCSAYRETHGGADALRDLDWQAILARPPGEMRFLRALVDDLAEACGNTSLRQTSVASETSRMARRTPQVLRNI
ncbi:MAG: hypothetical protein IPM79_24865 [Polyangiaceae bacterium]|nr:hypothetical protein [Polyangiaceae bacterium]